MKVVELEITKSYKAQVVVDSDENIIAQAEKKADNMNHNHWSYQDTEFDAISITDISDTFTREHITLLECGYPYEKVKKYSKEDAEGELEAINIE
ncbi:hypothetical protein [Virgibacillus salexigens]|uniref:Phage protein n=1 Tax=Virgibacillus kapii TaxID=1638645 RepID=A0ABQ2DCR8_9BACI|nr:hypothetical protein [Virgibacillus kapii]GGJ51168.1 hypothetical protein GCM10007111_11750 [Virgibacillus kapii]